METGAAIGILRDCEQSLRRLVAEAASRGDYARVLRVTEMATEVAAMAEGEQFVARVQGASRGRTANAEGGTAMALVPRRGAQGRGGYPRFFRRGDELVKVGWSRKERKEYHHAAPQAVVRAVEAAVRRKGTAGGLFKGDEILPVGDMRDGAAVPNYQGYVALAWLKHLGLVEQRGRRTGYALIAERQADGVVAAAWPALPEWRG